MANKKVAGNVTVTYGGNALTNYLNTASLQGIVENIDTTDFGDSASNTGIPGNASWSVNVGGPWDPTLDGYLGPEVVAPAATADATLAVGIDTVTYTWTASGAVGSYLTNYTIDASNPSAGITWSGVLTASGTPVRS